MFLFRKVVAKSTERSELRDKLPSLPDVIADSLISKFTETVRGSTK
jgi:DNA-directed RNA polymerase I subunit RPA49